MNVGIEKIIRNSVQMSVSEINTCSVGVIVDVDFIESGYVSVQPLINKTSYIADDVESAVIHYVPFIMPSTNTCGIVLPINVGDSCLLIYTKNDIENFKLGVELPHSPKYKGVFVEDNAVALIGFNSFYNSPYNPKAYTTPYKKGSVLVVNNKRTSNECSVELSSSGEVNVTSATAINARAPVVNVEDVIVNGVGSLKQFMLAHTHNYTDDGNPMVTAIPNI